MKKFVQKNVTGIKYPGRGMKSEAAMKSMKQWGCLVNAFTDYVLAGKPVPGYICDETWIYELHSTIPLPLVKCLSLSPRKMAEDAQTSKEATLVKKLEFAKKKRQEDKKKTTCKKSTGNPTTFSTPQKQKAPVPMSIGQNAIVAQMTEENRTLKRQNVETKNDYTELCQYTQSRERAWSGKVARMEGAAPFLRVLALQQCPELKGAMPDIEEKKMSPFKLPRCSK